MIYRNICSNCLNTGTTLNGVWCECPDGQRAKHNAPVVRLPVYGMHEHDWSVVDYDGAYEIWQCFGGTYCNATRRIHVKE